MVVKGENEESTNDMICISNSILSTKAEANTCRNLSVIVALVIKAWQKFAKRRFTMI